jgi:hypothetical protein
MVWKNRCNVVHGPALRHREEMRNTLKSTVHVIYGMKSKMDQIDKQALAQPIHITTGISITRLQTWIKQISSLVHMTIQRRKRREKIRTRPITHFFQARQIPTPVITPRQSVEQAKIQRENNDIPGNDL